MIDAVGSPQSALLLGATSDIGVAIAEALATRRLGRVVLAARTPDDLGEAQSRLRAAGATDLTTVAFDARDRSTHLPAVDAGFAGGDLDCVIVAWGLLGDAEELATDADAAVDAVDVNFTAAVSVLVPVLERLKAQGHGVVIVLSSVAGERPRASNAVYGATKAGLDAFSTAMSDRLAGSGVRIMTVRPGFVTSKMTTGLEKAPLATTPEAVAAAVVRGLESGREIVWVPPAMRWVMAVLRHVPRKLFRLLPV